MKACKLQRHYFHYISTTIKVWAREELLIILLNTQAAELTWD